MKRAIRVAAILAGLGGLVYAGLAWLSASPAPRYLTGYIEGEALYYAAPASGRLARLAVERGARVAAGTALFRIDSRIARAELQQAKANLKAAAARARDTHKGQRPAELAVIEAQREAAAARLTEAKRDVTRIRQLATDGVAPASRLDQAEAAFRTARANYEEAVRRLAAARLAAREDRIAAAEAEVDRAKAAAREAKLRLDQLSPSTETAGRVEEVFYRPGEWVPANQPIVALLPDRRITIRFFVPEGEVARYRPGRRVTFRCDGCGPPRRARIVRVAARPEYTPPVIYSRESRDKLVFLVEAAPERPGELAPGQPIDVTPLDP